MAVYDYNLTRLKKRIAKAQERGNHIEVHALGILVKGIEEGIWTVLWDRGEPVFAMADEDLEKAKREIVEKS